MPVTDEDLRTLEIVSQALDIVTEMTDIDLGQAAPILAAFHLAGVDLQGLLFALTAAPRPVTRQDVLLACQALELGSVARPTASPTPVAEDDDTLPPWAE